MAIPYSRTVIGSLPWYSLLIVCGILATIWLAGIESKRKGLPRDTAVDLALVAVPCGIVGARLYYVAMTWELFAPDPLSILYVWQGGVAIYGGVIGGALGVAVYARRKKLGFLTLADCLVPGLLLAQAIGRWGNYFNMEAYGPPIANAAYQFFPLGVLIPSGGDWTWHMATFFYESAWDLAGFAALWLMRRSRRRNGDLFCWYFLIYGSGRFIIEQLREDSLYLGGVRASQYLSLALCAASACALLLRAAGGRRARGACGLVAALALIARWAALDASAWYGALWLAAAACAFVCARPAKGLRLWLILPFAADLAGLGLTLAGAPLAPYVHSLLCSVTLPAVVWLMADSLDRA